MVSFWRFAPAAGCRHLSASGAKNYSPLCFRKRHGAVDAKAHLPNATGSINMSARLIALPRNPANSTLNAFDLQRALEAASNGC
jgi:hypothetical protein